MKFDGDAERDGSNPDGRAWGALLPELTPPHPMHRSCRISLQQFQESHATLQRAVAEKLAVPHFSHSCSGMATSYRGAEASREKKRGGSDFPAKPPQAPKPRPRASAYKHGATYNPG